MSGCVLLRFLIENLSNCLIYTGILLHIIVSMCFLCYHGNVCVLISWLMLRSLFYFWSLVVSIFISDQSVTLPSTRALYFVYTYIQFLSGLIMIVCHTLGYTVDYHMWPHPLIVWIILCCCYGNIVNDYIINILNILYSNKIYIVPDAVQTIVTYIIIEYFVQTYKWHVL